VGAYLQSLDRDQLQKMLVELDQALYNHQQWHYDLLRSLACRLPSDKHDIAPNAHEECRFGQWYYSEALKNISDHPGFIGIGEAHQHMHQIASQLLINLNTNNEIKPVDYDNFSNALMRLRLEIGSLKSELEVLLYNRDPLTMTVNRINMLPLLREQQELSKRNTQNCCIAMLDIDFFKKVNDKYGHPVGDKVLTILAHYLIENLRPYDKIFRYGGEEFLLCMPQVDLSQAFNMVDRLRDGVANTAFNVGLNQPIHITVSCGIALLDPTVTIEQSIDHSDKALYLAKSSKRNNTKVWGFDINSDNNQSFVK